jgi:hypothetical protein
MFLSWRVKNYLEQHGYHRIKGWRHGHMDRTTSNLRMYIHPVVLKKKKNHQTKRDLALKSLVLPQLHAGKI